MKDKFFKNNTPPQQKWQNPVDYFNRYADFIEVFTLIDRILFEGKNSDTLVVLNSKQVNLAGFRSNNLLLDEVSFELLDSNMVKCVHGKKTDEETIFKAGEDFTKFELITILVFKEDYEAAYNYVKTNYLNEKIPYIRIGTDYYKIIYKTNRYGVKVKELKNWKKDEIKQDYTNAKQILARISKMDDFVIVPDNKNYQEFQESFYNLYNQFPHVSSYKENASYSDFENIHEMMCHIFGEQVQLGYTYFKVLYEHPKQILPILTLVSAERQTGKTTFLNFLEMLFGGNYVLISPNDLTSSFNELYSTKNIIAIDETTLEKQSSVEKLKSISTQKTTTVNKKFVSQYSIPFFGKVVISTNKEKDFMRIDEEEIRFWVRKVPVINRKKKTNIEDLMCKEIPDFLAYLENLPDVDFSKDRMVFTKDEIKTEYLTDVVKESKPGLQKDIEIFVSDYFKSSGIESFYATSKQIKERWFEKNSMISPHYISKILRDNMKMNTEAIMRFTPFEDNGKNPYDPNNKVVGTPFMFKVEDYLTESEIIELKNVSVKTKNIHEDVNPF